MGGDAYWYTVPHESDLNAALQKLRVRELRAGRYNPVVRFLEFPVTSTSPSPGAQHPSIEAALEAAQEDGTRSILDIVQIGEEPDFFTAAPVPDETLEQLYGTTQPSAAAVEENMDFLDDIEREQAAYIVLYENGRPDQILFADYSFD